MFLQDYKEHPNIYKSGVYCITNVLNDKCYVGSSKMFSKRLGSHLYCLRKNKHHSKRLQASFNKYGIQYFEVNILETVEKEFLIEREQFWLDTLKPVYNTLIVADRPTGLKGLKRSVEQKARMSLAARLRYSSPGERLKTSISLKGKIHHSKETKEKFRQALLGKPGLHAGMKHTEESKLKMSQALKGTPAWNKGIYKAACINNHIMDEINTKIAYGRRKCRECCREAVRRYRSNLLVAGTTNFITG